MRDTTALLNQIAEEQEKWVELRKRDRGGKCDMCAMYDSKRVAGLCYQCRNKYEVIDDNQ